MDTEMSLGWEGMGGSMSYVVGLPNNSYKPITNVAWVRIRLCKLQKRVPRLIASSDKVYQLLSHGRLFSSSTLASSTTKTGHHDIADILLKVLSYTKKKNQINLWDGPILDMLTVTNSNAENNVKGMKIFYIVTDYQ